MSKKVTHKKDINLRCDICSNMPLLGIEFSDNAKSVSESINRACIRFSNMYKNATSDEILNHKIKKYTAYELYKKFNTLIIKSYILYRF